MGDDTDLEMRDLDYPEYYGPPITIRKSTSKERAGKFPPIVAGGKRIRVPKYVVCNADYVDGVRTVFGLPQGGDTRAEAVFWAERLASKNGYEFKRPPGWEKIEGKLKNE